MQISKSCARLLGGAAIGLCSAVVATQPAHAGCTYVGGTRTCDTTTTTNTVYVFGGPATTNDRTIDFPPSSAGTNASLVILPGAHVDGYGLALTTTGTTGPDLHVVNSGTVATALQLSSIFGIPEVTYGIYIISNGSNVDYSGSGSVITNHVGGYGIFAATNGSGNVSISVGAGGVASGADGVVADTGGTGAVNITTTGAVTADGIGIHASSLDGPVSITVGAPITGGTGIDASSRNGSISVNVTGGDVTGGVGGGIGVQSSSTSTINIAAGHSVVSTTGASAIGSNALFADAGDIAINNSGTITGASSAIASGFSKVTINNSATGTVNGSVNLSTKDDTFNNSGTWNASGANSWDGGSDLLANKSGGTINVANGTTFDSLETFTNAGTVNVNGSLGFTGVATALTNSGTLSLAANSSVTGLGAISNSGVLTAGAGSSLSAASFGNAGTVNASGNLAFSGSGGFSNSGTLNLATGARLTSTVTAAAGSTSVINGSVVGAFANAGAASGTGTVTGAFTNSGGLSPGNGGPGIFNVVNGPFTQTSTGTLNIDVTSTATAGTGYDQVLVTGTPGTALLAGTLALNPQQGVLYVAGTNYDVVNAAGGITGAFATTTGNTISPFLSFTNTGIVTVAGTNQVYRVTVSRTNYATGIGASATANQIVVANGFQGTVAGATGDAATLVAAVDNMTAAQAQSFFDQVSPESYGAYANALYNQGELFTRQVALQMHATPNQGGVSVWGRGYGEWGEGRNHNFMFGSNQDIYGLAMGVDYRNSGLTVGAAGGYSHDNVSYELGGNSGHENSWQFGGYASYAAGPLDLDLQVAYEHGSVHSTKTINVGGIANVAAIARAAAASPSGHLWRAVGTIGYDASLGGNISARPFVGIDWSDGQINSFAETGANAADLNVNSIRVRRTDAVLGLDVGSKDPGIAPYARIAYKYDLKRRSNNVSANFGTAASAFTVSAVPTGRSEFDADAGLSYSVNRNFMVFAGYEGTYRNDLHSNGVSAGFRVGFGAEAASPPPPPAPPPPPPPALATQTCPDGSAIAASATCPAPPPPPPPPLGERGW